MDTQGWTGALKLSLEHPELLIAAFLIACAAFGFAWWLRGHWAKDKIEALNQRLELAREQAADVQSELADVQQKVAAQESEIAELRQSRAVEPAKVERLAQSNNAIRDDLNVVVNSTGALFQTLNIGHLNIIAPLPKPSATRRSG
jgi:septal ring factor EnvC (AmiA/AmiB activator)